MKKYTLSLMALLLFAAMANAQDLWTKFRCNQENSNKNLLFIPETSGDETKQCTFFDGETAWNYREIIANQDSYRVNLHSGCTHAHLRPNALSYIEFSLPHDRRKQLYQQGGYYIPVMITLPFAFTIHLVGKNNQGEELFWERFSCQGIS